LTTFLTFSSYHKAARLTNPVIGAEDCADIPVALIVQAHNELIAKQDKFRNQVQNLNLILRVAVANLTLAKASESNLCYDDVTRIGSLELHRIGVGRLRSAPDAVRLCDLTTIGLELLKHEPIHAVRL
jgi:hypothetical protein